MKKHQKSKKPTTTKPKKQVAADREPEVLAAPAAAPEAGKELTLGEAVAAAKGRPGKLTWPHDIGSQVLLKTEGYPDKPATIAKIHDHGGYALYDLVTESGTTDGVPAHRIACDFSALGEADGLRARLSMLERHRMKGDRISKGIAELQAQETREAEALSKLRKKIGERQDELAAHVRSDPYQMELEDVIGKGDAEAPKPTAKQKADAKAKEAEARAKPAGIDQVDTRMAAGDTITMESLKLTVDDLVAAALRRDTSLGKPPKVQPVALNGNSKGPLFVLTDVQKRIAVLRPLLDVQQVKEWPTAFVIHELPSSVPADLTGYPVKVGRKVLWLAPPADALLVKVPASVAMPVCAQQDVPLVGKDAAAGA